MPMVATIATAPKHGAMNFAPKLLRTSVA